MQWDLCTVSEWWCSGVRLCSFLIIHHDSLRCIQFVNLSYHLPLSPSPLTSTSSLEHWRDTQSFCLGEEMQWNPLHTHAMIHHYLFVVPSIQLDLILSRLSSIPSLSDSYSLVNPYDLIFIGFLIAWSVCTTVILRYLFCLHTTL
jgi:hypothetical protein